MTFLWSMGYLGIFLISKYMGNCLFFKNLSSWFNCTMVRECRLCQDLLFTMWDSLYGLVCDLFLKCFYVPEKNVYLFLSSYIFILIYLNFSVLFLMFITFKRLLAIANKDKISTFSDPLVSLFPFSLYCPSTCSSAPWHYIKIVWIY